MEELENIPCKQLGALLVVDARCTYSIWVTCHHHLYLESLHPCELGALLEVDARCTLLTLGGENILEKLYHIIFGLSNQGGVLELVGQLCVLLIISIFSIASR